MDTLQLFVEEHQAAISVLSLGYIDKLSDILKKENIQGALEYAYNFVDSVNDQSGLNKKTSCGSGCNFCCYGEIHLSGFEGSFIISYIDQFNIPFDKALSARQNEKPHKDLKYVDKKCVMINKEGACSIYDIRPMICRIHNATTDPKKCDESKGFPINTGTLRTIETVSMALAVGILSADQESYTLHKIIFEHNN